MNNLLMWVAGILVAALLALFAVPPLVDWNQYRGAFEEEVSRLLGREVRVGGRVGLRFLPVPYVEFEKVSIADAPGIPGAFLRAERFTMLLSVPPLLRGVVEARQLEIESPVVRLRFNESGGGNWQTLNIRQQDLAFVPTDIALQSASIRDGQIWLENASGEDIGRITEISGELSADALRGPYKFTGDVSIGGLTHQLRLATADADTNGDVQIQASASVLRRLTRHTLQGRIANLTSAPVLTGRLTTSAPLTFATANESGRAAKYELTTDLELNSKRAALSDIAVSFDSEGRPQQLTGTAQISWQSGMRIAGTLRSKWLDLDSITAGVTKAQPLRVLDLLAGKTFDYGSAVNSRFDLAIGQANLGGGVVSDLGVRLIQADGVLRADRISAALPGGTRLRAGGRLRASGGNDVGWQGHVLLRGASLGRFTDWVRPGAIALSGKSAGAFEFSGNTTSTNNEITVTDAVMSFAGQPSRGSMMYAWGEKPMLQLDWDAGTLDLSGFDGEAASPLFVGRLLGLGTALPAQASRLAKTVRKADVRVRLRARRVSDATNVISNVDVLLSRTGNKLEVGRSRFTLEPGLALEVEGNIWGQPLTPEWKLRGLVKATSAQSRKQLEQLSEAILGEGALPAGLEQLYPANLAFTTESTGAAEQRKTMLEADGSLRTERLRLSLKSSGVLKKWRSHPVQLEAKLDGRSIQTALAVFGLDISAATDRPTDVASGAKAAVPAFLRLSVSGIPNRELRASATLANDTGNLRFKALSQPDNNGGSLRWRGSGRFALSDTARTLSSLSSDFAEIMPKSVVSGGHFEFAQLPDRLIVEPVGIRFGDSRIGGRLEVHPVTEQRSKPRVSGTLETTTLDVATVSAPLLRTRPANDRATDQAAAPAFWTDTPFDLQHLARFDAELKVLASRLRITPDLTVRDAKVAVSVSDGNLKLSGFAGRLRNGSVSGSGSLSTAPAGAKFGANLRLANVPLQQFAGAELKPRVGGTVNGSLSMAGQALSPRALMTTLRGEGQLALTSVRLPGLNIKALSAIADEVVVGNLEPAGLSARIGAATRRGAITIGRQAIKLSLADGALQLASFARGATTARTTNRTTIDLVRMLVDSHWQVDTVLEPSLNQTATAPVKRMPPVEIVYSGPLARLSEIEPNVSIGDLQRELTVRRMEHDVQRLERLRREDEARAKAEAERLERQRQEQLRALEEEARKRGLSGGGATATEPGTIILNPRPGDRGDRRGGAAGATIVPPGTLPGAVAAQPPGGQPLPPPGTVLPAPSAAVPSGGPSASASAAPASASPAEVLPEQPVPRPRPKRRKPRQDKWNPFADQN